MSDYVTPEGVIEEAAKAAFDGAFMRHAPEDAPHWDVLLEEGDAACESWREVARATAPVIAGPAYAAGVKAGLEAARDALEEDGYFCPALDDLLAESERSEG